MKRSIASPRFVCVALCLCFFVGESTSLRAQQPTSSSMVAVVDLPKVFEAHVGFKARMDTVQQQMRTAEKELQNEQKELTARNAELKQLNPSSEPYRQLESQLARQLADLQVQARQTKKAFMQREAVQYHAAYQEILAAVQKVAEKYNIGLVLRFDATEIDPQDPQSVAMGMSRAVVVQRNLDITQLVAKELRLTLAQQNSPSSSSRR